MPFALPFQLHALFPQRVYPDEFGRKQMSCINFSKVSKSYGDKDVLVNVSFSLPAGSGLFAQTASL